MRCSAPLLPLDAAGALGVAVFELVPKERATNDQNLSVGWRCALAASLDAVGCL